MDAAFMTRRSEASIGIFWTLSLKTLTGSKSFAVQAQRCGARTPSMESLVSPRSFRPILRAVSSWRTPDQTVLAKELCGLGEPSATMRSIAYSENRRQEPATSPHPGQTVGIHGISQMAGFAWIGHRRAETPSR